MVRASETGTPIVEIEFPRLLLLIERAVVALERPADAVWILTRHNRAPVAVSSEQSARAAVLEDLREGKIVQLWQAKLDEWNGHDHVVIGSISVRRLDVLL